jgi:hypothetical protein
MKSFANLVPADFAPRTLAHCIRTAERSEGIYALVEIE